MEEVVLKPIITEESLKEAARGHYTFAVSTRTDKKTIKEATQKAFDVEVVEVRTITYKGKSKRSLKSKKVTTGKRWKKALVFLKTGQKIALFEVKEEKK